MRLIDADALTKQLEEMADNEWNKSVGSSKGLEDAIDVVESMPTIKTFTLADIEEQYRKGLEKGLEEARQLEERKRPYRWLNRSSMTSHNEECGKCHFLFREMRQYYPYCPMCGTHLLPCYKTKER